MRSSFIVRPAKSAALTALTFLFTFAVMTTSAKAIMVAEGTLKADQVIKSELIQVAKVSGQEARAARKELYKEMRDECRSNFDNRQDRRNCMREAMQERRADRTTGGDEAGASTSVDPSINTGDRAAD